MSIHDETEADTRAERIDPVLAAAGWGQNDPEIRRAVCGRLRQPLRFLSMSGNASNWPGARP